MKEQKRKIEVVQEVAGVAIFIAKFMYLIVKLVA